ncbi:MAG: hypothetical protein K0R34_2205 [Herbinix sp.]|jgi:hypothetical protein|nr:hypothetical protein [Herbinix sp.]
MDYCNDSNASPSIDNSSKNSAVENDVDYGNSSEISNPHPATATPNIPSEMPNRGIDR